MKAKHRIEVDFIACRGRGMCAYLLPDNFDLDEWGYPILTDAEVAPSDVHRARRAARLCPELALRVEKMREAVDAPRR